MALVSAASSAVAIPARSNTLLRSSSAKLRPVRSCTMSDSRRKFWFTYEWRVPGAKCSVRVPAITRAASVSPNGASTGEPCSIAIAQ